MNADPLRWTKLKSALLVCGGLAACGGGSGDPPGAVAALPHWSYDSTMVFPADRSLHRPEDGVALQDGRLLVTDQEVGLRQVEPDGTSRPFGHLTAAGYSHHPPQHSGGANGLSLEPDGIHVLLADVFGAAIYRVNVATEAAEKVYQHRYGINAAVRDSRGAIWFTQSAHNTPEEGEARMWASVEHPAPEGALLRLASENGKFAPEAVVVVDSLYFGNGVAIDERNGYLYLAETTAARVLRFRVDLTRGTLSERSVFVDSVGADNLELDVAGNLWVASPLTSEILVVNTATGERHTAFSTQTAEQAKIVAEFNRRGQAGEQRMELFTPAVWAPLPGLITGVIVGPGTVYLTGLGNALVRLPR
jgi:sugar lactone lactonase YvrE